MQAYDITMLTRPANRSDSQDRGWCFGLPPGITPEQWPLDPNNGYPLVHGFTILLPEDYRCHGPDIVALSFFGTPCDMNAGMPIEIEGIANVMWVDSVEPEDPFLKPFWRAERARHGRLHRMPDPLDCAFAVILLTRREYEGTLCRPPHPASGLARPEINAPAWLDSGAAHAYWRFEVGASPPERIWDFGVTRDFGCIPSADLEFNRAVTYLPRAFDPNAGLPTCDRWDSEYKTGYMDYLQIEENDPAGEKKSLRANHSYFHIGGTMRPCQQTPRFSPFHIGFEENCGGWNFGGGNAQLDFRGMTFDWACG